MPPDQGSRRRAHIMTDLRIRPLRRDDPGDLDVLRSMLYEAAFWRPSAPREPLADALASPALRIYHEGWGRPGDRGRIAEVAGGPVGAAWYRRFPRDEHGYGFVDEAIPEITVGVAEDHRRQGIGRALLSDLLLRAGRDGVHSLSLSVEDDNPARRLYASLGFRTVVRDAGASTMVVEVAPGPSAGPAPSDRRRA